MNSSKDGPDRLQSLRSGEKVDRAFSPPRLARVASDAFAAAQLVSNGRSAKICSKLERKVGKWIEDDKFQAKLDGFIPRPSKDGTPVRRRLRDAEFREFADFCETRGYSQWSRRPRTFALLQMIGYPYLIEHFIQEGLKDISLPYSEGNLPSFMTGIARHYFLDCQNYVLNDQASALEKPGSGHQHVGGSANDYFTSEKELGVGGFGQVDAVTGQLSLKSFARKRIRRGKLICEDRARLETFENELETLKLLSHRHLVQLVGSYTDASYVGLIMTPVADMNLATYLRKTVHSDSTRICIRRFFGCLSTALSYLHQNHVQHKDIKPENIVVKKNHIYLTDFGTSRCWDSDDSKSTQGTLRGFTSRYCAPEVVQHGSSRNESRDIWSLGCVFYEMCTVLANHTDEEMCHFMETTGSQYKFIRENPIGALEWTNKLSGDLDEPEDQQVLGLTRRMCVIERTARPTAKELLSTISNFSCAHKYYELCCADQLDIGQLFKQQPSAAMSHWEDAISEDPAQLAHDTEKAETRVSNYQPPTVNDPTTELTIQASPGGHARKYALEDVDGTKENPSNLAAKHETRFLSNERYTPTTPDIANLTHPQAATNISRKIEPPRIDRYHPIREALRNADSYDLRCPWPNCSETTSRWSSDNLCIHVRESHGVHELFWMHLLKSTADETKTDSRQWVPGQIVSEVMPSESSIEKAFILKKGHSDPPARSDPFVAALRREVDELKKRHTQDRAKKVQQSADVSQTARSSEKHTLPSATTDTAHDKGPFSLLPEGRRPDLPKSESRWEGGPDDGDLILSPEPIPESFNHADLTQHAEARSMVMPQSTLAPSYILAKSNRFSYGEILAVKASSRFRSSPGPLFVYGSLMFPSVIRAQAARFTPAEGIYSRQLQRRLHTTSADWSDVDRSLGLAAQMMTPALLQDFQLFEVSGVKDAALVPAGTSNAYHQPLNSSFSENSAAATMATQVKGFIVKGLSKEAFECLDFLYSENYRDTIHVDDLTKRVKSDNLASDDTSSDDSSSHVSKSPYPTDRDYRVYRRQKVKVTIILSDGRPEIIDASTYTCGNNAQQRTPWSANKFVWGEKLRELSTGQGNDKYDWVGEESRLATQMGTKYAMRGDALCEKILKGDIDGMDRLLKLGHDANALCHHYGTPLQAAAAKGQEEIVYELVKHRNVNPNMAGGKYHLPLVAAICEGHEDVVRTLLRYGANPRANSQRYISPLYQSISFGDVEITRLLLEKGGWLADNYEELLDMATEADNKDMSELLKEYDIRNLHKRKQSSNQNGKKRCESAATSDGVLSTQGRETLRKQYLPAIAEILRLKGEKGKWTGIKLIKVLRIAFSNEVPDGILRIIGSDMTLSSSKFGPVPFIELLAQQTKAQSPQKPLATSDNNPRTRLVKDNDDEADGKSSPPRSYPQQQQQLPHHPNAQSSKQNHGQTSGQITGTEPRARDPQNWTDDNDDDDDDVICLSCDDRGGRKGTPGRRCESCQGAGELRTAEGRSRRYKTCRECNGFGLIFSARDRCRVCNSADSPYGDVGEGSRGERDGEGRMRGGGGGGRRGDDGGVTGGGGRDEDGRGKNKYRDYAAAANAGDHSTYDHTSRDFRPLGRSTPSRPMQRSNRVAPLEEQQQRMRQRQRDQTPRDPPPPYPGR